MTNLGAGAIPTMAYYVSDLLSDLLSQNPGQAQRLLSLESIAFSAAMGCWINGHNTAAYTVTVAGNDYVGGMQGKGDGVYLTPSTPENIAKLPPLDELLAGQTVTTNNSALNGLTSVTASGDYAGGALAKLWAVILCCIAKQTVAAHWVTPAVLLVPSMAATFRTPRSITLNTSSARSQLVVMQVKCCPVMWQNCLEKEVFLTKSSTSKEVWFLCCKPLCPPFVTAVPT